MLTFNDIASDAQLEGSAATTATQKKGPRPKNAEQRCRMQQQGQLWIDKYSHRGPPTKDQHKWVAAVVNNNNNARQRHRTEWPAMAAQERTWGRG